MKVSVSISYKESHFPDAIKNIEQQRPLTQVEQREVKRQRRQLKNREYAQNSRSKKKQMLEKCQEENEILTKEKLQLQSALIQVQSENQRLATENLQLKSVLIVFVWKLLNLIF